MKEHIHVWEHYHADYCHRYENGSVCYCGEKRIASDIERDFSDVDGGWWHWGRAECKRCRSLAVDAGLDPRALGDEDVACDEITRQFEEAGK